MRAHLLLLSLAAATGKKSTKSAADSIDHVDEDRIDEIIDENEKHLVIFFYEPKSRCGSCARSLSVLEAIDDGLEANGLIDVVKTDDREAMRRFGVHATPAIVYVRRGEPILYDGEMDSADEMTRWLRAHEQVANWDLDDDDFEDRTESASPVDTALDWFIMFYDSRDEECTAAKPLWETVSHKLRGLVHCGSVDVYDADDVADRFKIDDDDDCPEFILLHRGKMFEYKDPAVDITSLVAFALYRYKEQRGHRVPEAPTQLEEFVENVKEGVVDYVFGHSALFYLLLFCASFFLIVFGIQTTYAAYKDRKDAKKNL